MRGIARITIFLMVALTFGLMINTVEGQDNPWTGFWQGSMTSDQVTLDLFLKITTDETGMMTCLMDIPAQSVKDFAATQVAASDDSIEIMWFEAQARYKGKRVSNDRITGVWEQRGYVLELNLERNKEGVFQRPQEPKGQVPYRTVDVSFKSGDQGNISMSGTLTYPSSGKADAAVVLVSGSGAQNRDSEIFGHKPFLVLADYLTRHGIAVLRYDDRGVGQSTGSQEGSTTMDFADDARAAIQYLKEQSHVSAGKVGLIGHSEGGTIGIIVGSEPGTLDFLVLLASPGTRNDELLIDQTYKEFELRGIDPAEIKKDTLYARAVYDLMRNNPMDSPDTAALRIAAENYFNDSELIQSRFGTFNTFYESQLAMIMNPWFYHFVNFDPSPYLRKIACPVLALNGSLDSQVAADVNLNAIQMDLEEGKCKSFTVRVMPGLNHMFQPATTGAMQEYGQISTTFDPAALTLIQSWIAGLK